jgi:hydroxymethylglutaryl-CoA lyase
LLAAMGLATGIDLSALLKVREIVAAALPDQELYGFTPLAGLPLGFRGTAMGERVSVFRVL